METTAPAAASGTIQNARHRTSALKLCYHLAVSNAMYLLLAPAAAAAAHWLSRHSAAELAGSARSAADANPPLAEALLVLGAVLATAYLMQRPRGVYLVDFACYKPADELKVRACASSAQGLCELLLLTTHLIAIHHAS